MMSTTSLASVGPRRLEPEQRRTQLLKTAKGIIEREGIGACTIDLVSTEAGVTAQLVHKYFGTRSSLLQTLYAREEAEYEKEIERRLSASRNFEDIVRVFVTANLDLLSPTTAIGQLRSMPEIIPTQTSRDSANRASARRALVRGFRTHHETDDETMAFALRLGSAASIEAATIAAQHDDVDRAAHVERTVHFILAGIRSVLDGSKPGS